MKQCRLIVCIVLLLALITGNAIAESWVCPSCGNENTTNFCGNCGTKKPLEESWVCPACSTVNTGNFCTECGRSRENENIELDETAKMYMTAAQSYKYKIANLINSSSLDEVYDWYMKEAENGNATAMYALAAIYSFDFGIKDYEKSVYWAQKGVDLGNPDALAILGEAYYYGRGVPENKEKGKELLQKAADLGSLDGMYSLSTIYFLYGSSDVEKQKGLEFQLEAAKLGHAPAMYNMGCSYEFGDTVIQQDPQKAAEWFQMATDHGHSRGAYRLGMCYEDGFGVSRDLNKAYELYMKSIDMGEIAPMSRIGVFYLEGKVVPKDPQKAIEWFKKGAEYGDDECLIQLGYCYEIADGVPKDLDKAYECYEKVAERGIVRGALFAGIVYLNQSDTSKIEKSMYWLRKAAEMGNPIACGNLGMVYQFGEFGVQQDFIQAYNYLKIAVDAGQTRFQGNLEAVELAYPGKLDGRTAETKTSVDVRLAPHNGAGTVVTLRKGRQVTIVSENGDWCLIQVDVGSGKYKQGYAPINQLQ